MKVQTPEGCGFWKYEKLDKINNLLIRVIMKKIVIIAAMVFTAFLYAQEPACCSKTAEGDICADASKLMKAVAEKGQKLQSFSSNIMYSLTEDPDIFETTTVYTGTFRYLKTEKRQYAMIDFTTRQEDELPQEKYQQRYIFDGVWLTRIDYQLKQVNRDQVAAEDKPEDVFKLISKDFPLIGFSGVDTLSGCYEIAIAAQAQGDKGVCRLTLTPKEKPDSEVKYSDIQFGIDSGTLLPKSIRAVSAADNSICNIELDGAAVDTKIDEKLFELTIPEGFTESVNKLAQ